MTATRAFVRPLLLASIRTQSRTVLSQGLRPVRMSLVQSVKPPVSSRFFGGASGQHYGHGKQPYLRSVDQHIRSFSAAPIGDVMQMQSPGVVVDPFKPKTSKLNRVQRMQEVTRSTLAGARIKNDVSSCRCARDAIHGRFDTEVLCW